MKKILVTGKNGQVGKAYCKLLGDKAIGLSRDEFDLSDPESLTTKLEKYKPDVVVNCAAYTAVDKAEEDETNAFLINAQSVGYLADYCFANGIPLVHFSTDYVFPGTGTTPWKEDDEVNPLNAYGRTKLAGEKHIVAAADRAGKGKWLIFRTSWVYDEDGKNFLNTMLRLGKEKEVLSVINDQRGAPTYAYDIAEKSYEVFCKACDREDFPSGVYHLCASEETSWHGFCEEIFRQVMAQDQELAVREVMPIGTKDYPTPAKRPLNSRLNMDKLRQVFGVVMPSWKDGLTRCLENKGK